ncbi:MAG TPA: Smr/MutS family protein [Bacteroidales bacterium]|nr:Smr/MutS family protein [Bacteroidales bacterium]HQI69109.1 Smr/MutS family protein [Bacteroidales bacterium]
MSKQVLDLHEIYNKGHLIDKALQDIIEEAVSRRLDWIEIIPGKGSGQLKKKVLRFLEKKDVKNLYHRIEKDRDNFGKIYVYFRH